jgi:uncharacterized iron-regulated membrane protein
VNKRRIWIKKLHLYIAVISAIPILVMSITGTALVYKEAIDIWATKNYMEVEVGPQKKSIDELKSILMTKFPGKEYPGVVLPREEGKAYYYWIKDAPLWTVHYINPYTGEFKGERAWEDWTIANVVWWLTDIHYSFKQGTPGSYAVGISSLVFACSIISGLFLWWPRKSRFDANKFKLKTAKRWRQTAYNLHAVIGFYAAITLLFISISGTFITFWEPLLRFTHWVTLSPPPHKAPEIVPVGGETFASSDILVAKGVAHLKEKYQAEPIPASIGFPNDKNIAVEMSFQGVEGKVGADHWHVFFNAATGEIIGDEVPPNFNRGQTLVSLVNPIHYGTWGAFWGKGPELITRLLWFFAALTPIFLIVTGFSIVRKSFWRSFRFWDRKKV